MSRVCTAEEMSAMFGPAVYMNTPDPSAIHIMSACAQRYLVLDGHVIPIGERMRMIVGSDSGACDVLLLGARVSARHAEVLFHNGCYFVRDLGSMYGTYVNGRRISCLTELHIGDEIWIKPYRMTFTTSGAPQPVTA